MSVAPDLVLGQIVLVLFKLLFVSFEILDHQVFADQFVVVGEMVHDLGFVESDALVERNVPDLGLKRFRVVQTVAQ